MDICPLLLLLFLFLLLLLLWLLWWLWLWLWLLVHHYHHNHHYHHHYYDYCYYHRFNSWPHNDWVYNSCIDQIKHYQTLAPSTLVTLVDTVFFTLIYFLFFTNASIEICFHISTGSNAYCMDIEYDWRIEDLWTLIYKIYPINLFWYDGYLFDFGEIIQQFPQLNCLFLIIYLYQSTSDKQAFTAGSHIHWSLVFTSYYR